MHEENGNNGNTVQVSEEKGSDVGQTRFLENRGLIEKAQQGGEYEAAQATEELILLNRGLVKNIALRFRERGLDFDDLMQIGTIGLLKAIRSFDLERGTCFSTYAVPMIFGEIRRTLRDEGPIKVGRYYKKLGIELMRARNDILNREGCEAHISRLAEIVGVSVEEAAAALDAMAPVASLSELVYGDEDGIALEDTLADRNSLEEQERFIDRMALREVIGSMPLMWRQIVALRYFRNMTQQATANELGLSQVKVSREEKKILEYMKKEMRV